MKLAQQTNTLETNIETKSQDFSIGDASKIIGILRNFLYQHKVRTLVQEYMSNARDAMREAKTSERIVVTIPNAFSPVFRVRDFGPGITPQRMKNVFVQYGETTKGKTNSQTGGFGIGAKSAWAYTDSFTIVSITGGQKRTYVAHTGKNNQGTLELISTEPTDEGNGTEIQVAVKQNDLRGFANAVLRACYFWDESEYPIIKGSHTLKPVRGFRVGNLEILSNKDYPDFLGIEKANGWSDNSIVSLIIDGIPYSIDKKFSESCEKVCDLRQIVLGNAFIHVSNGVVDLPATRESIAINDLNKTVLDQLAADAEKHLGNYITAEFQKAKTIREWIEVYRTLSSSFVVDKYSVRGAYAITNNRITSTHANKITVLEIGKNGSSRRGKSKSATRRTDHESIHINKLNEVFFLDNPKEFIVTQNKRIAEYLEFQSYGASVYLLMAGDHYSSKSDYSGFMEEEKITLADSEKALAQLVKDLNLKPLSTLPYTAVPRAGRAKVDRSKEQFTLHRINNYSKSPSPVSLEEVERDNRFYLYVDLKDYDSLERELKATIDFAEGQGKRLCALSTASIKIVKDSKHFTSYLEWKKNFVPTENEKLKAMRGIAQNASTINVLFLSKEPVKDKQIRKMMETYEKFSAKDRKLDLIVTLPEHLQTSFKNEIEKFSKEDTELTKLLESRYPLVGDVFRKTPENAIEIVIYMNAKYSRRNTNV